MGHWCYKELLNYKMEDLFKPLGPGQPIEKKRAIVAIDPGANGGIAVMVDNAIQTAKMPETAKDKFDHLKELADKYECVAYTEKVHGMPGSGASGMFNYGNGYGHLEMALIALNIRTVVFTPQRWIKHLGLGTRGKMTTTQWKNKLKARAQQLYPNHKVTLANADAILIAEYAKSIEK